MNKGDARSVKSGEHKMNGENAGLQYNANVPLPTDSLSPL